MSEDTQSAEVQMRDHWWWRPGWRVGRRFYTFHFTFADQPDVADVADHYLRALLPLGGLDPVPGQWLHLTTQGIGFVDETDSAVVEDIVDCAKRRCAGLDSFDLVLGPVFVDPEAVQFKLSPVEPLRVVRDQVRAAIGEVLGPENIPEPESPWNPHVSIAYSNRPGGSHSYVKALSHLDAKQVTARVSTVDLIILNRDQKMYQWAEHSRIQLGDSDNRRD